MFSYVPTDTEIRVLDSAPPELTFRQRNREQRRTVDVRASFNGAAGSPFAATASNQPGSGWAQTPPSGMLLRIEVPF
jgi:hypothetical protein